MSELRRRIFGRSNTPDSRETSPTSSRDASPAPPHPGDDAEYKVIPRRKLERLKSDVQILKKNKKGSRRRTFWIFVLGGFFGIFAAGFFATSKGGLDTWVEFAGMKDVSLDSLYDILPAGIIKDVQELQVSNIEHPLALSALMLTKVSLVADT